MSAFPYNSTYQVGVGFAPYMLRHLEVLLGEEHAPMMKVDQLGLLKFTQEASPIISMNNGMNLQQIQVPFKQRWTALDTQTAPSCDYANNQQYQEVSVGITNFRQIPIALQDQTVQQYETEASETVAIGLPPTQAMNEVMKEIYAAAAGLLAGVNQDLWSLFVANLGTNPNQGNSSNVTINIEKDITLLPLNDGITQIQADAQNNNVAGKLNVIGSGFAQQYFLQQPFKQPQFNGLDTAAQSNSMPFYNDPYATTALGSNQIVVVEENAIQRVDFMQFTGTYAGQRPGRSIFATLKLPIQMNGVVHDVDFDMQLIYSDCATTYTSPYAQIGGYSTVTIQRGWNIILSKYFGLFTVPANAYRTYDNQYGNRGTFRYTLTNNA